MSFLAPRAVRAANLDRVIPVEVVSSDGQREGALQAIVRRRAVPAALCRHELEQVFRLGVRFSVFPQRARASIHSIAASRSLGLVGECRSRIARHSSYCFFDSGRLPSFRSAVADLYSIRDKALLMASRSSGSLSSRARASDSSYDFLARSGCPRKKCALPKASSTLDRSSL